MSDSDNSPESSGSQPRIPLTDLFRIFLMAGLTFGGGLAIVTVLERELVRDRKAIPRDEFMTHYALARVVPTGTQTALAISLGNRFGGLWGSIVAAVGLLTPVFVSTVALTVGFTLLESSSAVEALPRTVLPAAMALIAVGVISLSKDMVGFNRESALALAAFLAAVFLTIQPGIVLLMGGLAGIVLFRQKSEGKA